MHKNDNVSGFAYYCIAFLSYWRELVSVHTKNVTRR
ncbi:hypothetical protein SEEM031_21520 [Salmonella enterica subsp. enterica serovar Montevideo str. SARB31]|nr:hypothetical protein SEEM031_21520 [Salmonella enterica subsp. enterica serovar Montevideo str. SARB31]ESF74398.1 hypothetical protein SEEPB962_11757 [Salmonella enterica subsp. enterica serovar Paratyphi B str. ATCC 51962]